MNVIGDTANRNHRKPTFPGDGTHHVMESRRPRIVDQWSAVMGTEDDVQQAVDEGVGHGQCSVPA